MHARGEHRNRVDRKEVRAKEIRDTAILEPCLLPLGKRRGVPNHIPGWGKVHWE